MKYKLNIIEPWESGTEHAVDSSLIKEKGNQFLLFVEDTIKVRGENAHYFICELKNEEKKIALKNHVKGIYPINMVFDKKIISKQQDIPDINTYRANFLSGEIII